MASAWADAWGTSWGDSWGAGAAPAVEIIRPSGGLPISYKEWLRRQPKEDEEEPEKPIPVIIQTGVVHKTTPVQIVARSPELEMALRNAEVVAGDLTRSQLRRLAKKAMRRRNDDDWFLLN